MTKSLKIILITLLCILVAFSLTACSGSKIPVTGENEPVSSDEQTGKNLGQDDQKQGDGVIGKIITDNYPSEITKYLEANKKKETRQAFNINNRTYVVLTMGQQPSAGYSLELKDLILKDGALKVFVKYEKPMKDAAVATVITYPSLVIETDDIYEGHYEILYDIEK